MKKELIITGEKAFDMLPAAGEIYEKLKLKEYALEKYKEGNKDIALGLDMIFAHVFKNSPKIKEEVFEICSIALEVTVEDAKKEKITTILGVFKTIILDPELMDFLKLAV